MKKIETVIGPRLLSELADVLSHHAEAHPQVAMNESNIINGAPREAVHEPASATRTRCPALVRRARRALAAAAIGGSLAVSLSCASVQQGSIARTQLAARPGPVPVQATDADRRESALEDVVKATVAAAETRARLFAAVSRCGSSLSDPQRRRIAEAVHREAERHGYDPLFVMAMIEVESTCSPTANGSYGAVGLTQIKPSTARAIAKELGVAWEGASTLVQPSLNVRLGVGYLAKLEQQLGDPYLAIVAYNQGPGRVSGMTRQHAQRDRYVKKVLARYEGLLLEPTA